ncbi:MAG TPA: glycosyltransferase family 2 protein [Chitinophagaceae bacterium]|nr:glycosyltransferase family 2 protein [Chitinophagaceae bacterium]
MQLFFWISVSILFFCYLGYGILLLILDLVISVFRPAKKPVSSEEKVPVTLVITAYNEEPVLEQKIKNCLELDYPAESLEIVIVTDGSSDHSPDIVARYPRVRLMHQVQRKGKYAAIKRAMAAIHSPIVVFSDANTILNKESISRILAHYNDPRVGGVAGEKKISRAPQLSAVGEAEGLYWKYESSMKKLDAGLHSVVGAAGELYSIRSNLFTQLNDNLILDDFVISMHVCLKGYQIAYEPGAFATEWPSVSLAEEEKRKTRISAGAYQSIGYLGQCLNIFKHPVLSFQFISRRLLRWIFCPVMLVVLLITNIIIVLQGGAGFYHWFLYGQAGFYLLACFGGLSVMSGRNLGILSIPFYFVFMNYCLVKGFFVFIRGRHTVLWEKALRQEPVNTLAH